MKKILSIGVAVLAGWTAGAPPAMAQNREHQQLAAEARMLQEQAQQLAIAVAALNEALSLGGEVDQQPLRRHDERDAQGIRRPEAAHRQHGERCARGP